MKKFNQKKFIRNMLRLVSLGLAVWAIVMLVSFITSIRPPEGNKTLNIVDQVSNDIDDIPGRTDTSGQSSNSQPEERSYTFLVAAKDKVADNTDTIMLVKLDLGKKEINILHIPRDTMLDTNRKVKKVNSSYQVGGIELFEKDVASLTGFFVNRYVLFDIEGVEKAVDAIGGVYFDVPQDMKYYDPTQNLSINIKKGYQHLTGEQVVKVARYRSGYFNGDIGRIEVQQKLIKALAKQALKPENILRIPEIVGIIMDNVETDIDLGNMIWLANQVKDFSLDNIHTYMLPGIDATIDGLSYWLPYKNELLELINDKFNPLDTPITDEDVSIVEYPINKGK
ncbi:MAG: LCP family protein [Clostridiaceae bacterium]|nr:LCP family protein [Clostridiaceae bacterium]